MKKTSKILAVLLTIAMVLSLVPTAALAAGSVWTKVELADIQATDTIAITMSKDGTTWILPTTAEGSNKQPLAGVTGSVAGNALSTDADASAIGWNIVATEGGYHIMTGESYLYVTATNNGVRIGTPQSGSEGTAIWTVASEYLSANDGADARYLGVYNNQDWRCYKNTTGNTAGQTLAFWKLSEGEAPAPSEPEPTEAPTEPEPTEPEVTAVAEKLTALPADGDVIVIYNSGYVMGSAANGKKLAAVAAEVTDNKLAVTEEMAQLKVAVEGDNYIFTLDGKYLTSGETGNGMSFAEELTDCAKWTAAEAVEGAWYLTNVGANYNGNYNQAMEYYSGFTTYGIKETEIYQMQMFLVERAEAPVEPTEPEPTDPEAPAVEPLKDFEIAAEWIWGETIAEAGVDGAEKIVSRCAEMGITDIYLLIKGTGGKISWLNTQFPELVSRTDRDVLQETIDACRAHGLRIHAWICNGQDSAYKAAHPEAGQWHYIRERDNNNIALYNEGYVEYMKKIVAEIAAYDVDGLHLDYIRYNHLANGWSETDLANLEAMGANIDNVKYLINKTLYAQYLPEGESVDANYIFNQYNAGNPDALLIAQYRRNVVVEYAKTIIEAAKAVNPELIITAALQPETAYDHAFGGLHYGNNFADAPELYDYIVPMAYSEVFGQNASWMVKVAEASIDQGNQVVMGLNSYYGNAGVTSKMLMADIEAVRGMLDDEAYAENVLGICHFRNTQFSYAKVSYNRNDKSMTVKTINANPAYDFAWVQIELQEGLVAKAATLVDGYAPTTQIEIAEDGSYVRYYGNAILGGDCEGTLTLTYEGDLDVSKPAALVRIYMTNESRAYNVYEDVTDVPVVKNGVIAENGGLYYYVDGEIKYGAGLVQVEGGYYYYIRSNGQPAVGAYWASKHNDLLPEAEYNFDMDGRMDMTKHGVVKEEDGLYFYLGSNLQRAAGLVEFEGDYYYVRTSGQVAVGEYWVTNANGLVEEGFYCFAPSGKLIQGEGIVEVDGTYYYVIDGAIQYAAGLVEVDGAYYYVRSNGTCAIGQYWVTNTNGLMEEGLYTFGEDGKMIQNEAPEEAL